MLDRWYIHYVDSNGAQASSGPHYCPKTTEMAARTIESEGGRNVTVVRDRGCDVHWTDLDGY